MMFLSHTKEQTVLQLKRQDLNTSTKHFCLSSDVILKISTTLSCFVKYKTLWYSDITLFYIVIERLQEFCDMNNGAGVPFIHVSRFLRAFIPPAIGVTAY